MYDTERTERHLTFMLRYRDNLEAAVRVYPEEYAFPVRDVPVIAIRMAGAIIRGSYNKDSRAIQATCRQLGIAHTYKAIGEYLRAGVPA